MGERERIPDFLDIKGRLHTVHHRPKPMTEGEFLERVDTVFDPSIVPIRPMNVFDTKRVKHSLNRPVIVDISKMSDSAFERHLEEL